MICEANLEFGTKILFLKMCDIWKDLDQTKRMRPTAIILTVLKLEQFENNVSKMK
jgi:hypothetical protein